MVTRDGLPVKSVKRLENPELLAHELLRYGLRTVALGEPPPPPHTTRGENRDGWWRQNSGVACQNASRSQ